jgi:hypothetical protein
MANCIITSDALDLAMANINKAKGIASLAGNLDVSALPDYALSNAMWGLIGLLEESNSILNAAEWQRGQDALKEGVAHE